MSRVLVIEDGHEYSATLSRFLPDFTFVRAGNGAEALALLADQQFSVAFLDMRFDRVPHEALLGDHAELLDRMDGDAERAWRFLEDNQGAYVLAALRGAGHRLAVVFSYDFDGEPRRWQHMKRSFGPLSYLNDAAGPELIRSTLEGAATAAT